MRICECCETDLLRDDKIRWSSRTLMAYHVINSLVTLFSVDKLEQVVSGSDFPTLYIKAWCLLSSLLGISFAGSTVLDQNAMLQSHEKTVVRFFYGFFNLRWYITYLLCSLYYFIVFHTWIYYVRLTDPVFSHQPILLLYTAAFVVNIVFSCGNQCGHSPGHCCCTRSASGWPTIGNLSGMTRIHNIVLAVSHAYICLLARNYWGVAGSICMAANMISEVRPESSSRPSSTDCNNCSSNNSNGNGNHSAEPSSLTIAPSVYVRRQVYLIGSILSSFCITFSFGTMMGQSDVVVKNFSLQAILYGQQEQT